MELKLNCRYCLAFSLVVLIVPFMELKLFLYDPYKAKTPVLIVPFMELKPLMLKTPPMLTRVLIVPFMELKRYTKSSRCIVRGS